MKELDTVSQAVGKAVKEKTNTYFSELELIAKLYDGGNVSDEQEQLAYRVNLLGQLSKQAGVKDTYYGLQDGSTYSIGAKGRVKNFNAKAAGREWVQTHLRRRKADRDHAVCLVHRTDGHGRGRADHCRRSD